MVNVNRRDFLAWSLVTAAGRTWTAAASFASQDLSIVGANTALSGYGLYEDKALDGNGRGGGFSHGLVFVGRAPARIGKRLWLYAHRSQGERAGE